MDILYINQLMVMARIGIHDWEKQRFQKLFFDLQIIYNNTYNINNIFISNYLDYTQINQTILDIINTRHFPLIEDVAETTAKTLINKFNLINQIQIKVNKPRAIPNAGNVGICINRIKKIHDLKTIKIYTG